ncbi:MAG: tRNA (adenosine(37)-N6)-threonylcarbamoyltransferase complex ATPase subunit type 1 TsaE [Magnetococcales bacterium]|nr:tRNA (adenosine(37)-N6)-threonylcarbamoyltransferase complex ATPase subunit type 1 TsaE [Magnetococcales bacterium]
MGHWLARSLEPGGVILLLGAVGAGKSVLARGIIRGLGHEDPYITSPTFTLVNTYTQGRLPVYHFDLYRLESIEALYDSGAGEYLEAAGVCVVEWPEKLLQRGMVDYLEIRLADDSATHLDHRLLYMRAYGRKSERLLEQFTWPRQ